MGKRGMITPEIQELAKDLLCIEIDQTQLRLMPYVQYCLMNSMNLDPAKINDIARYYDMVSLNQHKQAAGRWLKQTR